MEDKQCIVCFQRCIQSDFSEKLVYLHGITESGLPFSSTAVVQVDMNEASKVLCDDISPKFILIAVAKHEDKLLTKYIDEYSDGAVSENGACTKSSVSLPILDQEQAENNIDLNDNLDGSAPLNDCFLMFKVSDLDSVKHSNFRMDYTGKFPSPRLIAALAPFAYVGAGSYTVIEDLIRNFLAGSVEDHIMSSINLLVEGKTTSRDGTNFLRLVGMPDFSAGSMPGCIRHPNLCPVLGMLNTVRYNYVLYPQGRYTLEDILHFSPNALRSEWHIKFLVYQILSALAYMHSISASHGYVCPANIVLTDSCWSWLTLFHKAPVTGRSVVISENEQIFTTSSVSCCSHTCSSQNLYADLKLSPSTDWNSAFMQWWRGKLSNYDYLLVLNRLAGRRWGDHSFHTVMPWVIDFSVKPDENTNLGWRDLRKSKWRLAKGDEQMDFTFLSSEIPHHVSDECLSELAVCSYKARRLPLRVLRSAVRTVYEPNEYPSTLQRLYQWTPDECIPEFYCDTQIFVSLHPEMSDLAVPPWASCNEEFISMHRAALESDHVSCELHHWIDITFGYKMTGEAAVAAKNVMLPVSNPTMPRSAGRRQLFSCPHPMRQKTETYCHVEKNNHAKSGKRNSSMVAQNVSGSIKVNSGQTFLSETANLEALESAVSFSEFSRDLDPIYLCSDNSVKSVSMRQMPTGRLFEEPKNSSNTDLVSLLASFNTEDHISTNYLDFLLWMQKSVAPCSKDASEDIFSVGCILAELYLKRPLFNLVTLTTYMENGDLSGQTQELPPDAQSFVEVSVNRDWRRRPSAKSLLESPYFPATVRSVYLFLAPLHLLAKIGPRLKYATKLAKEGALSYMGPFAAAMCAPYCLSLITTSLSDVEAETAFHLLMEFLKCLECLAVKSMILPTVQKILQARDYSYLKVLLLQNSFVREIWSKVGKQMYLDSMHPSVLSNLFVSPHKKSASAASVLLIGSCEELGVPVTIHQTVLPLVHFFGKGLCSDGIDTLVRIGGVLGEFFIVRQLLPLVKNAILSCVDVSCTDKREPLQSGNASALSDGCVALDGLISILPREVVLKALVHGQVCLHISALSRAYVDIAVLKIVATTFISLCRSIGADMTALHVLPQLNELFEELAFSQGETVDTGSSGRNGRTSKLKMKVTQIDSRTDTVLLLYPSFASFLGIEKLRQHCASWLLLEQLLEQVHNWKWDYTGEASKSKIGAINSQKPIGSPSLSSAYTPAKLLLNGVGWSIPQTQAVKGGKSSMNHRKDVDLEQFPVVKHAPKFGPRHEAWFWFPSPATIGDGPEFSDRARGLQDEAPWKIRASIVHSVRAHSGALRSLAVCNDECTAFTGGAGPGHKGTVQKWELSRMECVFGYHGHEEVVTGICILSTSGRVASCDGAIHIWKADTGKFISAYTESSVNSSLPLIAATVSSMQNSSALSGGILSSALSAGLYTCIHQISFTDKIIAGIGNGSLRLIDVARDQQLHLWKSDPIDCSFSSLVTAICSCGSGGLPMERAGTSSSWLAVGQSSGYCRLLDARSGNVFAYWRAHNGFITKLAAPEDHLLLSSSVDRTLRVWDLRRNFSSQMTVISGHHNSISDFAVWGRDVISVSGNKIGVCSLSRSVHEDGWQAVSQQKLYSSDGGISNMSALSNIYILPFSRLILVGTEDGHFKVCS